MNVIDAAYLTGKEYAGGAEALALRMQRPNLPDELNPNRRSAKLGVAEAVTIQALTGDFRVLHSMATELGHMAVPLPDLTDLQLPGAAEYAQVAMDFAKLMQEAVEDAADGEISDNELLRIERAAGTLIAHTQLMVKKFAGMNAATKARRGVQP